MSRHLPKLVVEDLKQGKTVEPELYHDVTIYMSDIVGLGNIIRTCSPASMVDIMKEVNNYKTILKQFFLCMGGATMEQSTAHGVGGRGLDNIQKIKMMTFLATSKFFL